MVKDEEGGLVVGCYPEELADVNYLIHHPIFGFFFFFFFFVFFGWILLVFSSRCVNLFIIFPTLYFQESSKKQIKETKEILFHFLKEVMLSNG